MEIKTEFLEYTNKIDKLLNYSNNQKHIIYVLISFILLLIFVFVFSFFLKQTGYFLHHHKIILFYF